MDKIDLGPHPFRNISVFIIGTIVSAFGTVVATDSVLGVTPSASLPYVIKLSTGLSLGTVTFIMQMVFFLMSFAVVGRKNYKVIFLLSIPTLVLYSFVCDVFMDLPGVKLNGMGQEWIVIAIATAIHALGISLQLASNLSMVPLDMFANHLSARYGKDYGMVKVVTDVSIVVIAVVISFIVFGELRGVGLGTVFAAVFVGSIVSGLTVLYKKMGLYERIGHLDYDFRD